MKAIVLAAGYATRLYPQTLTRPKALLPVAGRPMVEHVLEKLAPIAGLDGVYLVTNSKFADQFRDWAARKRGARAGLPPTIVDDGTIDEHTRLGAIGDLDLAIRAEGLDDDLVVVAGDNLFSESLADFGRLGRELDAPVLAVYDVGSLEAVRRYSSIVVDERERIAFFEEKPERPRSTLAGIALYFYPRSTLSLVRRYLAEGNEPDQPGRLVQWLYRQMPVYIWRVPGLWFDIGSQDELRQASHVFGERAASSSQS